MKGFAPLFGTIGTIIEIIGGGIAVGGPISALSARTDVEKSYDEMMLLPKEEQDDFARRCLMGWGK